MADPTECAMRSQKISSPRRKNVPPEKQETACSEGHLHFTRSHPSQGDYLSRHRIPSAHGGELVVGRVWLEVVQEVLHPREKCRRPRHNRRSGWGRWVPCQRLSRWGHWPPRL